MPYPRNEIEIVGNLGKDPEMRYTPGGLAVTSFSVAVSREWDQDNEKKKETTWFRVTAWGKLAEQVTPILHKGQQILVKGRMTPDPQTGGPKIWKKHDGEAGSSFEIKAIEIWLSVYQGSQQPGEPHYEPVEDDIPF